MVLECLAISSCKAILDILFSSSSSFICKRRASKSIGGIWSKKKINVKDASSVSWFYNGIIFDSLIDIFHVSTTMSVPKKRKINEEVNEFDLSFELLNNNNISKVKSKNFVSPRPNQIVNVNVPQKGPSEEQLNSLKKNWGLNESSDKIKWPKWLEKEKNVSTETSNLHVNPEQLQQIVEHEIESQIVRRQPFFDEMEAIDVTNMREQKALLCGWVWESFFFGDVKNQRKLGFFSKQSDGWHIDQVSKDRKPNLFYKFTKDNRKPIDPRLWL